MKITVYPGNWIHHPTPDQVKQTKQKYPNVKSEAKDANGYNVFLVTDPGVLCTNPAVGIFTYPQAPNGSWFVPYSVCSACILYSKSETRLQPRCDR